MEKNNEEKLTHALIKVAPGTELREGLDHILSAKTGGLVVIGDIARVNTIVNGGFEINCDFVSQKLYELAKMDGAIILDDSAGRILLANVHLVPDSSLPTTETGMRHRTAERVARQTKALVISISQKREVVSLYLDDIKYALQDLRIVLVKGNQALQTLEKYKSRLDQVSSNLNALEFEDLVALVDVLTVIQRGEMVERIGQEIRRYISELGSEGRLLQMQLDELMAGVEEDALMLIKDYSEDPAQAKKIRSRLAEFSDDELFDILNVSKLLGFDGAVNVLDRTVHPRGYRLLKRIPRLPVKVVNNLVDHFQGLQSVIHASVDELDIVEGVGEVRAHAIQEGLRRLKEYNLLERYM